MILRSRCIAVAIWVEKSGVRSHANIIEDKPKNRTSIRGSACVAALVKMYDQAVHMSNIVSEEMHRRNTSFVLIREKNSRGRGNRMGRQSFI